MPVNTDAASVYAWCLACIASNSNKAAHLDFRQQSLSIARKSSCLLRFAACQLARPPEDAGLRLLCPARQHLTAQGSVD